MTDVTNQEEQLVNNPEAKEVVSTPEANETVKDYEAEAKNKAIALQKEREERRAMESKIAEYEAKEKELQEKELKKKGKYEELLTEKEKELLEFKSRKEKHEPLIEQFTKRQQKEIDTLKNSIPDSEKERVEKLIDGKDHTTQVEILEKMSKRIGSHDDRTKASNKRASTDFSAISVSDFTKLNSESKKKYMSDSMKEHGEVKFI